ncbi:hypothetical protein NEMIN01_2326 [Nematocida minor]|uniref:uncharacterized protein n=1 Tax=Nematocida minor TaxID=1912983 RepID=UPI0022204EA8|nr:uncharacterized protein NEMIN01_2326 [Nematocida minor]KAI5192974.1 hypothetical protein NEMIN01_2326 [Nematocida minor]
MPHMKSIVKIAVYAVIIIAAVYIVNWIRKEYNKSEDSGLTEYPFKDINVVKKEKETVVPTENVLNDNRHTENILNENKKAEDVLNEKEQLIKEKLCKIAQLHSSTCSLSGVNPSEKIERSNSFVKLVTKSLSYRALSFGSYFGSYPNFTLDEIIIFLITPAENRKLYSCGNDTLFDRSAHISVPSELKNNSDDILNILLTFVDLQEKVQNDIIVTGVAPSAGFKFSKFKYFSTVKGFAFFNASLHSNTCKDMENLKTITRLGFYEGTELVGDPSVKVNLENLKYLSINNLKGEDASHFLCFTKAENLELSVENADLPNTQGFFNISSLKSLKLERILFKEMPDFTFIKKSKNLETLHMDDVFYGYDEKYEESLLPQIKKNIEYLNVSQVQRKYNTYSEKEKKIIDENKTVGREIAPEVIHVNRNIYQDLGLSQVNVGKRSWIYITFPILKTSSSSYCNIDSHEMSFSLEGSILSISLHSGSDKSDAIFQNINSNLELPFVSSTDIKHIALSFYHKITLPESFMNTLIKSLFLYEKSKSIRHLYINTRSKTDIDTNTIIECGRHFKNLKIIKLSVATLTDTPIKDENKVGVNNNPEYEIRTDSRSATTKVEFFRQP